MPAATSFYPGKQTVQKHVEQALAEIIQPDEWLLAAFHGQALSGEGYGVNAKSKGGFSLHDYLLVSDQRVIFWARGMFSRSTDGFHYDDIASVEEATGLITGDIVLNVRGAKERMRSMVKEDVPIAARLIRDLIVKAKGGCAPAAPGPASPSVPQAIYVLRGDGTQDGPFNAAQVQRKVFAGEAAPETFGWHEGLADWQPLSQIIRLPSLPSPARPTPPPPAAPMVDIPAEPAPATIAVAPGIASIGPVQPSVKWYMRKGWQIFLFICFPYVQVPLMWYWKLFTRRTRIWVTAGGCIWCLILLGSPSPTEARRKDFAENKAVLLAQVKAADQAHDYQRVLALGDRYSSVHDPEMDNYLYMAHAGLKEAAEKTPTTTAVAGEQPKLDDGNHPLVVRVRALNPSNAEEVGMSDGMTAATGVIVNLMQMGDSDHELHRKFAKAKSDIPGGYDLVAKMYHLDPTTYATYRRGWVRGFELAAPQ